MPRISSYIVALSVAVLLISLVAACLWRQAPAESPPEDLHSAAPIAQPADNAIASEQPTLAPPRPVCERTPEQGVVYASVEVEIAGAQGQ